MTKKKIIKKYLLVTFLVCICTISKVFACTNDNIKVSVILPICNNDNVNLSECLDSLVNQTQEEIEIICINYGSTNNNDKILEEYARKDSRIIVVEQKNKESSVAKNKGLELAKGEYITFVDANSYMDLNSYDWAYQIAKRNDDDVLEFGIRCFLDEDESGKTEKLYRPRRDRPYKVENIDEIIDEFYEVYITNKLYKRSFLEENNIRFMEQNVYEDVCFSYMVMPYIKNYQTRKNCFCNYKKECDSIVKKSTSNLDIDKCINTINVVCREWEKVNIINKNGEYLILKLFKPYYKECESIIEVDNTYNDRFLEALGQKICSKEVLDNCDVLTQCLILKLKNNNVVKEKYEAPKISVILPIYNVEPWLRDCLDTLTNQTFEELEIICINDGSTDSSGKILEEYAKKDKRIVIYTQENRGISATRNRGLELASGEYLTYVDPDDYINLKTMEVIYEAAKKNNDDILEYGTRAFAEKTGEYLYCFNKNGDRLINVSNIKQMENAYFEYYTTNKIYNRAWLEKTNVRFVDGIIVEEDVCFNLMLLPYINKYESKGELLYNYRRREKSLTNSGRSVEDFRILKNVIKPICKEWEKNNVLSGNEDFLLSIIIEKFNWAYYPIMMNDNKYACELVEEFDGMIDIFSEEILEKCNADIINTVEKIRECASKASLNAKKVINYEKSY